MDSMAPWHRDKLGSTMCLIEKLTHMGALTHAHKEKDGEYIRQHFDIWRKKNPLLLMFPIKMYCLRLGKNHFSRGQQFKSQRVDSFYFQMQIITTASWILI